MLNNQNIKEGSYLLDFVGADEGVLSVIDRNEFNSFVVIDKDDVNTIKFHIENNDVEIRVCAIDYVIFITYRVGPYVLESPYRFTDPDLGAESLSLLQNNIVLIDPEDGQVKGNYRLRDLTPEQTQLIKYVYSAQRKRGYMEKDFNYDRVLMNIYNAYEKAEDIFNVGI